MFSILCLSGCIIKQIEPVKEPPKEEVVEKPKEEVVTPKKAEEPKQEETPKSDPPIEKSFEFCIPRLE